MSTADASYTISCASSGQQKDRNSQAMTIATFSGKSNNYHTSPRNAAGSKLPKNNYLTKEDYFNASLKKVNRVGLLNNCYNQRRKSIRLGSQGSPREYEPK